MEVDSIFSKRICFSTGEPNLYQPQSYLMPPSLSYHIICNHTKLEILSSVGQQLGWPAEEYSHKQKWSHEAHYSHQVRNLQYLLKLNSKTVPESN